MTLKRSTSRLTSRASGASLRAFTLIELLAVVTIFGLATAALTAQLAGAQSHADFRSAVSMWQSLDARARLLAKTSGHAMRLEMLEEVVSGDGLNGMRVVDRSSGEILSVVQFARGLNVQLHRPFNARAIQFDAIGQTIDYEIVFASAEKSERWRVLGITGVTVRTETGGAP